MADKGCFLRIDADLWQQLKVKALADQETLTAVLNRLIRQYLGQ